MNCTCCGKDAEILTIELAVGSYGELIDSARYYFPSDSNRKNEYGRHNILEVPFCRRCMRILEDTFRASILYLQKEHNQEEKPRNTITKISNLKLKKSVLGFLKF
jgi:hypothetical protein